MFGIDDPQIWLGYAITIGLVIFCVIYGWLNRDVRSNG